MIKNIPDSYKPGVNRIEDMNAPALLAWLEAELREQTHILAGKAEDYPVQAIVSHHQYLSPGAQKRFGNALETLVLDWRGNLDGWPETAVRAMLSLVAELRVDGAKSKLLPLLSDDNTWTHIASLQPAVLRVLATLAENTDRVLWSKMPVQHPKFAGMAFQVLTMIAPDDALKLLSTLPDNDAAVGSVARKLPDFVSQFLPERKAAVLSHIANAIGKLSQKSATTLQLSLQQAGFSISLPTPSSRQTKAFEECLHSFRKLVCPANMSPLKEYA